MMKFQKTRVLTLASLFVLFSMISVSAKVKKTIVRGMTKEEVVEIYGKPLSTSFDETLETWNYEKSRGGLLDPHNVYITICFDNNDKVMKYDERTERVEIPSSSNYSSSSSSRPSFGDRRNFRHLSDNDFNILYNKVRSASFDNGKLDLIQVAALGGYFTCSQCARLIAIFSFTDGKMKALGFVAPHIVDAQNAAEIYSQFTFSTDKDKAAMMIRSACR